MSENFGSIVTTEAPAIEPVSLDDAKSHVREDGSDQDSTIESYITAVRTTQENILGRCFITQTKELRLTAFPCGAIEIPRAPVQSITSITYVDGDGVTQTLSEDDYTTSLTSLPPRISPVYGSFWPITRHVDDAVTVTFVAGYGDTADDVPGPLKTAMLMRLADIYENREAQTEGALPLIANPVVEALEAPYKFWWFG